MALTDTLRIETVSADKRHVEATMPIVPEVFQPHGYLHGGATIALLETVASIGTEQNTDFDKERPFGIDVQVRHRKSGKEGTLRGVPTSTARRCRSARGPSSSTGTWRRTTMRATWCRTA